MWRSGLLAVVCLGLSASDAIAVNWNTVRLRDEFTDAETCRVEPGGEFSRSLTRGLIGAFRTLHFVVENRQGELRVGFMSEPLVPISGDIQVRVDANPLITITAADTPIDSTPTVTIPDTPGMTPELRAQTEEMVRVAMAQASPYRMLTGDRARDLLHQVLAGDETIWRVVTINAAASTTGRINSRGLAQAIAECGVRLD